MKYFLDTEFIEGFRKPLFGKKRHFIDLISIGIVAEDGREYYAISNEFNPKDADKWVNDNVISKLPPKKVWSNANGGMDLPNRLYKSNKRITKDIIDFTTPYLSESNIPEFYAYYADYDWVVFCSLFGTMIDLPHFMPMYCNDLKQTLDEKANKLTSMELSKMTECDTCNHNILSFLEESGKLDKVKQLEKHKGYPKQENEHNALADAKWNQKLHTFLKSL